MNKLIFILLMATVCACQPKTLEKDGGIYMEVAIKSTDTSLINQTLEVVKKRITDNSKYNPEIVYDQLTQSIKMGLPMASDPILYRDLVLTAGNFVTLQTYDNTEFYSVLVFVNDWIKKNKKEQILQTDLKEVLPDYPLFGLIRPNVGSDGTVFQGAIIGHCKLDDTSKVNRVFNMPEIKGLLPADADIKWGKCDLEGNMPMFACKKPNNYKPITSDMYADARVENSVSKDEYSVTLELREQYHFLWERMTRENIGRCLALVIDNQVYSAPRVNSEITKGISVLEGGLDLNQANVLASIIKSGELKANLAIRKVEIIPKK